MMKISIDNIKVLLNLVVTESCSCYGDSLVNIIMM